MPKTSEQSQAYNDGIDLADLIRALWQGKWLVIGVTLVVLSFGIVYLKTTPQAYTGSLGISKLPFVKADAYAELNELKFMPKVYGDNLLQGFVDDVKGLNAFEQAIKAFNYITQLEEETDKEFEFRVRATANDFSIVDVSKKKEPPNLMMRFTTQNPALATKVIEHALDRVNQNVNNGLLESFKRRQIEYSRKVSNSLVDLESAKKIAVIGYKTNKRAKLAILDEQAKIARSIDLATGSLSTLPNKHVSAAYIPFPFKAKDVNEDMDETKMISRTDDDTQLPQYLMQKDVNETPLYLRGFLVIEEEINILQTRKSIEKFIPSLASIERQKFELEQDKTIQRANIVLASTPIGTDQFFAAVYDVALVEYTSNTRSLLTLLLSSVLGGMLGIFVLIFRNALMNDGWSKKD